MEPSVKYIPEQGKVLKMRTEAAFPYKERPSDIGWDITLVGREDNRSEDTYGEVNNFLTGLKLEPPHGYYYEMMARSSLHRSGYMLATGTSIIDPGYRGELKVPLYKFKDVNDIELPFRGVQIVLKKANYAHLASIKSDALTRTSRGTGGFGSTGHGMPTQDDGVYVQNMNGGYNGDTTSYAQQTQVYQPGQRRPQAAPPGNHMF